MYRKALINLTAIALAFSLACAPAVTSFAEGKARFDVSVILPEGEVAINGKALDEEGAGEPADKPPGTGPEEGEEGGRRRSSGEK